MRSKWKKVAMIMMVGLLVAGPFAVIHNAAAQMETKQMITNAKAMNDKAATMLHSTMTEMDSMMNKPMSANEKAMAKMMHQMMQIMQMLIDSNKNLIAVVEHGNK